MYFGVTNTTGGAKNGSAKVMFWQRKTMNYLKVVSWAAVGVVNKRTNKHTNKQTNNDIKLRSDTFHYKRTNAIQMDITKQCNLKMLPFNLLNIPDKGRSYLAIEITICCW